MMKPGDDIEIKIRVMPSICANLSEVSFFCNGMALKDCDGKVVAALLPAEAKSPFEISVKMPCIGKSTIP